jgi:MSHA biogenesis protein MshG
MPETFSYTARAADGGKKSGLIRAESPQRVAAVLAEQQLIPTEIKLRKVPQKSGLFGFMKGRMYEDLIIFTRNLSTLYRAGIPILRALSIIRIGKEDGYFSKAVVRIKDGVQAGRSLADCMADFPDIFPTVYTATVAAGEHSGKLDEMLDSLGVMLERDMELKRQIKSSVRYPIAVISAIAAAFVILITFVIPRFVTFYSKMGALLPWPTRILIWLQQFISGYWIILVAALIVGLLVLRKIHSTPGGRHYFDVRFLTLPIFGDLIVKGNIARFSYSFQVLLKSGIPLVKALEMLSLAVRNSQLALEIRMLSDLFRKGRELGGIPEQVRFFPDMALKMINIGLESGSLDRVLLEVANHYDKEVDYRSRHLTALLEPILTVVLGVFVLIVALAIFLPMWNLIQVFRG